MRLGIDGWTFQRNDAADLAATLARIAADPAMLRSVRAASSSVRTVDDVCDDLLALYERCGTMAVST
jgi:hypothetical protein